MTTTRQRLRAEVFELADNRCEHPADSGRCPNRAIEMSHIFPRGMGHTGYRDHLANVMAACPVHARSTDDLSSSEWNHVPGWQLNFQDSEGPVSLMPKRQALAAYVTGHRRGEGWDV